MRGNGPTARTTRTRSEDRAAAADGGGCGEVLALRADVASLPQMREGGRTGARAVRPHPRRHPRRGPAGRRPHPVQAPRVGRGGARSEGVLDPGAGRPVRGRAARLPAALLLDLRPPGGGGPGRLLRSQRVSDVYAHHCAGSGVRRFHPLRRLGRLVGSGDGGGRSRWRLARSRRRRRRAEPPSTPVDHPAARPPPGRGPGRDGLRHRPRSRRRLGARRAQVDGHASPSRSRVGRRSCGRPP